MRSKWNIEARASLRQTGHYIKARFGIKAKREFMQKVEETEQLLMRFPSLGPIDPLFADRPVAYRSVNINGLSKMVYRAEDDIIYIAAFWDCRREPQSQAGQTE